MSDTHKTYDSVLAANYLLALAYDDGIVLNVTKVQKLLYMAYGYFLAKEKRTILKEEPKAWPYGPVFPRTRKKANYENIISLNDPQFDEIKQDAELTDLFRRLIHKYAKFTASQLSEWSHEEGGPWYKATKQSDFKWNHEIPNDLIVEYFSKIKI